MIANGSVEHDLKGIHHKRGGPGRTLFLAINKEDLKI